MRKAAFIIAGLIFALITLAHLAHIFYGFPITIGTTLVPMWVSGIGIILGSFLTFWMFSAACCCDRCASCHQHLK